MNLFKILFSFSVLFMLSFCAKSQTYLKKIPIETDDPFVVYTWAFDENINAWRWASVFETSIEHEHGWIYNREVNIKVDKYDILHALFIRGFNDCSDTTRVTIYGSFGKETIRDKPEFRKQILLNGKLQEFGTRIKRP